MKKILSFFAIAALVLGMASCNGNDPEAGGYVPAPSKGELNGVFSVGNGKQVRFSQGNLQYYVGAPGEGEKWSFAVHQYDYLGYDANQKINSTPPCNIDLFGWGTGNAPRKVSLNTNDFTTYAEWGNNKISNGGNEPNFWRTLTKDEWVYLFYDRTNADVLFGLGSVNGVNGTILLPDNWVWPAGASFTASTKQGLVDRGDDYYKSNGNNFSHNTYTKEQWSVMESAGAVFLPAAGYRKDKDVDGVNSGGYYWSASPSSEDDVCYIYFDSYFLDPLDNCWRYFGLSVRLVHELPKTDGLYVYPTTLPQAQEELYGWFELSYGIANYLNYQMGEADKAAELELVLETIQNKYGYELPTDINEIITDIDKLRPLCEPYAKSYFNYEKVLNVSDLNDLLQPDDGNDIKQIIKNATFQISQLEWDETKYVSQIFDLLKQIDKIIETAESAVEKLRQ